MLLISVIIWIISFASCVGIAIAADIITMDDLQDDWDSTVFNTTNKVKLVSIVIAIVCMCFILYLPAISPRCARKIPAPYTIKVWACLSTSGLAYYFHHDHAADGQPPERVSEIHWAL